MDIISMAQQARPKASGQSELLRAQFTALSSCVKMMPSLFRTLVRSSGLSRVTLRPPSTLIVRASMIFSHEQGRRPTRPGHSSPKADPLGDREDDFSELLALFEAPVSLSRFGQGEDTIDHRPQPLFADELQNRE